MTRRHLMGAAMFGAVALGVAGLAAAAGYFAVARDDDDDDEDEGSEANERSERTETPQPNSAPAPQPPTGAPR
jgi:hypothetical protein